MNLEQKDVVKQRYIDSQIKRIKRLRELKKKNIVAVADYNLYFDFKNDRWLNPNYYDNY